MQRLTTEELQSILELHSKWLRNEEGGIRANLIDANLRDANLSRADLSRADLSCADLRGADLRGADLRGADLSRADLRGADLRGADLSCADLSCADLSCAIKVPMHCKWTHGITDGMIHIGCEKRSVEEWGKFFASDAVITTHRNTQEFKQIHAIFNAYKSYIQTLNS
jgi:hypothetical protein